MYDQLHIITKLTSLSIICNLIISGHLVLWGVGKLIILFIFKWNPPYSRFAIIGVVGVLIAWIHSCATEKNLTYFIMCFTPVVSVLCTNQALLEERSSE
jgi:hypothetical protein